ncbi:MAG: hypothetical protein JW384_03625 [Nitrosomonadaceae bacterium]|nr:hypothetical protein [Nitrosomonadaceae bacterium]
MPTAVADGLSAVFDYTIWTVERDSLESHLLACGIEVKVRSRSLLCDQPGYARHPEADVPNARRLVDGILNLPIHEKLGQSDIDYVISSVRSFFGSPAKP